MKNEMIRKIVNVDKVNYSPIFTVKQEDDVVLKIALYRNSVPFSVAGQTITLGAKRSNNSVIQMIDGFSVNNHEIDITLKNTVIAVPGDVECDLEIKDSNGKMTTASFFITVDKKMLGTDNIYASNDMPAINKLETELSGLKNSVEFTVEKFGTTFKNLQEEYKTWKDLAISENVSLALQSQVNVLNQNMNFKIVKTIAERDGLENMKNGVFCYVEDEGLYFSYKNGEWEVFKSGSGGDGGAVVGTLSSSFDQKTLSISLGQTLTVDLFFTTPNVGAGTLHVTSNGADLLTQAVTMGSNKIPLKLSKGTHKLELYVVDRGGVYTNSIMLTVHCGGLDISTTFNHLKDYTVGTVITFPYMVDTVSTQPITTYFKIGNNIYETPSYKGYNQYVFPTNLGAGSHKVEVYSRSADFESNKISFTLVMLNSGSLVVSSLFDKKEAEEGDQLVIDYRVSMKDVNEFNVVYYVDNQEKRSGKAYNGANTFVISDLPMGPRKITIKVKTLDEKHEAYVDININIIASSYEMKEPVTQGLLAWFDAYGLTNQDDNVTSWKDKSGKGCVGTLYDCNFKTNGWIDNGLKLNGRSYAKLNLQPFKDNAVTGLTIDVAFKTEDIGDENARVLDCTTTLNSGVGCYIDTNEALIKSTSRKGIKSPFAQNERTRVTYVIDRIKKLVKIYINAVLSEVAFLTDSGTGNSEILENFQHDQCIYLNTQKGKSLFGDCTIYGVRVYGRPLDSDEVLQNHIADIKDKALQKKKWDFNHDNRGIPTMHFIGDVTEMTKDKKVELQIRYLSPDERLYGQSFDLPKCVVNWQGTSSIVYDVKNYKIRLIDEAGQKFKRPLRGDMIPESTFVLKADYMESSHAHNTGCAKIVNQYLYDSKLPPQETNPKVVRAIDGFPIRLFINGNSMGVFNFNLDKGNADSFGFDETNENCLSYEVKANSDTTAGAFYKWPGKTEKYPTELAYLKDSFEQRFPEEEDKPDHGYDKLKRVVNWVSDANDADFKANFEKYFNKEYTFKYYLFTLTMGLVDNLGKNMMLTTWDGNIWFPCFYDLDTCLSLDNSGYIQFDSDIEIQAGTYNTSGSQLWTKLWKNFEPELKKMYVDMRSTIFKEENLFNILLGEQIDKIPESLYNEDSQRKYIEHPKYIHMLHGSRREQIRKWLTERLLYLDSKMGYELHTQDAITVRANKQGQVTFKIKTYSPMYIKIKWSNEAGGIMIKKVGRNQTVDFSHTLSTATDQEILIYSAKHLKEIGDLTGMSPSSLTLGHAKGLTKLICSSSKLKSLGLDGSLKNLQVIDLTNCSGLGNTGSSSGINVSQCDNLKILKVQGTNLQNIQFNQQGGNLEELYLPNSLTSLYLANQYNLRTVEFPIQDPFNANTLSNHMMFNYGSKLTSITIDNCPSITDFGIPDTKIQRTLLDKREELSEEDFMRVLRLFEFAHLEKLRISNSLQTYKYYGINLSPNLTSVTFENMPNLKGLIITGNRVYGYDTWPQDQNMEGNSVFKNLQVTNCNNFDTLKFQRVVDGSKAFKFTKDFVWDLSKIPLKRFICSISLQNLKKLILPQGIQEFIHSNTRVLNSTVTAPDGSKAGFNKEDAPLETIIIAGQHDESFRGIDLGNIELKNVNLNGLTQKVNIIKNINCKAINVNPRMISEHVLEQPLENIQINLNRYKGNSLYGMFKNADITNIRVILDHSLTTTESMDYSEMFYNAKQVTWEKVQWLKKLPKGKFYRTFKQCDIDRLDIGHMIGDATTDLSECFQNMPNVTSINLAGADCSKTFLFNNMFHDSTQLASDIVIDRTGASNGDVQISSMLSGCTNIGTVTLINFTTARYAQGTINGVKNLKIIGMPKFTWDNFVTIINAYNNVTGTADIRFNENVVFNTRHDTMFHDQYWAYGYTKHVYTIETYVDLFKHLANLTNKQSETLRIGQEALARLSPEHLKIARDKNWSIIA